MRKSARISIGIFFLFIFFLGMRFFLPGFLALNKPFITNNILIEAWVSHFEIEQAVNSYGQVPGAHFFVVGRIFTEDDDLPEGSTAEGARSGNKTQGTWLYANSSLCFIVPGELAGLMSDTVLITAEVKGQEAGGRYAYFTLSVNGENLGGNFSNPQFSDHPFSWVSHGRALKSICIRFINDLKQEKSDRNLCIHSVTVNEFRIPADRLNTTLTRDMNKTTTGFDSQADETAAYLRALGMPVEQVSVIEFGPAGLNLTRAAAEQFSEFANVNDIKAFNVVSSGIHCRRTWITYKKVTPNKADVGVVNFTSDGYDAGHEHSAKPFYFILAEEYAAYLANWFQLTFGK